jgi:3-oxoacyl-[acyl-carrier-protein] synthase II
MDDRWVRPSFRDLGERRVVVTGLGAITPVGNDVPAFWDALVAGRSGIDRITSFDPVNLDCKIAGEVKGFAPDQVMPRKEVRRNDRYVHFAWAAALEAMRDAGLEVPLADEREAERAGVIIGSGIGGINTMIRDIIEAHDHGVERIGPFLVTSMIADMAAGYVAIYGNLRGPNMAAVSACASSNHAIGTSLNIVRRGDADVMVAGGAEAGVSEIPIGAFAAMRALSTRRNDEPQKACRPFDARRDGFVMAEGAGTIVIEALDHALARGATIHAELVGFAGTDDASHITLPAPGGRGAVGSMSLALSDAGLSTADVDYINAHGTSTTPNDRAETAAIKTVFGERAHQIPVSSTKSMTGHLLGAAGGIEAVACVRAIETGTIPPTINYEYPDPECDLDYVPNQARQATVDVAISNSFGFGGHNATVVFQRYEP